VAIEGGADSCNGGGFIGGVWRRCAPGEGACVVAVARPCCGGMFTVKATDLRPWCSVLGRKGTDLVALSSEVPCPVCGSIVAFSVMCDVWR
jgi:hypothetical protein